MISASRLFSPDEGDSTYERLETASFGEPAASGAVSYAPLCSSQGSLELLERVLLDLALIRLAMPQLESSAIGHIATPPGTNFGQAALLGNDAPPSASVSHPTMLPTAPDAAGSAPSHKLTDAAIQTPPDGSNPIPAHVAFRTQIYCAALRHHLNPLLLAAVAGQETGGPGADSGANVRGADGTGRGVFQIDAGSWGSWLATHHDGMNIAENADKAACILAANLQRTGGNVKRALHLYNAGSESRATTPTQWPDGTTLSYEDSVMRHLAKLQRETG